MAIEFEKGDEVYLLPDKGRPDWRIRGRVTEVKHYGPLEHPHTVLYDTDIMWPQDDQGQPHPTKPQHPCGGLTAHWLQPIDAVTKLAEVIDA